MIVIVQTVKRIIGLLADLGVNPALSGAAIAKGMRIGYKPLFDMNERVCFES